MDLGGILREQMDRRRAEGFAAFRGAAVDIRLPLREGVANDLLRGALPASGAARDLAVAFGPANRLRVGLSTVSFGFVKRWNLEFDVARAVDIVHDPRLRLKLVTGGLLGLAPASLVNALVSRFTGVTYAARVLSIDLRTLLDNGAIADLAPLLKTIHIDSDAGVFFFDFALRVE